MITMLEKFKQLQLERKSWLNALQEKNQEMKGIIILFDKIDPNYAVDRLRDLEVEYQELLIHLRACNLNEVVSNARVLADVIELPNNITAN